MWVSGCGAVVVVVVVRRGEVELELGGGWERMVLMSGGTIWAVARPIHDGVGWDGKGVV